MASIFDTSALYSGYGQLPSITDTTSSSLQSTLGNVSGESSEDELMNVCKSFEAYFVQKVIQQAKDALVGDTEDDEGEYMKYFGDIMTEQYANAIVESSSIGLAQQLYDSMKVNLDL